MAPHATLSFIVLVDEVFSPAIQPALLLVLHRRYDFCLGCVIASQFVGDDQARDVTHSLGQLAKELRRRFLVPTRLDKDVEHFAVLVDGAPKILRLVYEPKYPKAAECVTKDKQSLLTFYDFPAEHWHHIRTSNPIESTFASVRLRTAKTRGCLLAGKHSVDGIQTHPKRRAALAETAWS